MGSVTNKKNDTWCIDLLANYIRPRMCQRFTQLIGRPTWTRGQLMVSQKTSNSITHPHVSSKERQAMTNHRRSDHSKRPGWESTIIIRVKGKPSKMISSVSNKRWTSSSWNSPSHLGNFHSGYGSYPQFSGHLDIGNGY